MISTDILFNKEAREKLLAGVNIMANAVTSTLGPRGQNVAIAKTNNQGQVYERIVLHDGVSVARSIILSDEFENMGAQLLKQASQKQVDKVGDGTTLVMTLAQSIIAECMQIVSTGVNPMALRKGLEDAAKRLTKQIQKRAIPLKSYDEMRHIAIISAEDEYLGNLVAETLQKVGKDGVVDVEESKSPDTFTEYQQGMQIDKGYIHELFITDPERREARFDNPTILVTDKSITSLVPFTNFLNKYVEDGIVRPMVIISPDISGEALPILIQHKLTGKFYTLCIKAPSFGENQKRILQDIATLTGATFITEDAGMKFEDVTSDHLGEAEFVTSTKNETIISGGRGSEDKIKERIALIKREIEDASSDFDRDQLKSRLGKLTNGVSIIKVGGLTEVEMKERRERVLDSVAALRTAMHSGIVPGGEITFLHIRRHLKKSLADRIMYKALYKPFQKLITNADLSETEVAIALNGLDEQFGIDVTDGKVKDFIKAGIVDPAEVLIQAINNSVSVAIQIMTTGCIVVPHKEDTK